MPCSLRVLNIMIELTTSLVLLSSIFYGKVDSIETHNQVFAKIPPASKSIMLDRETSDKHDQPMTLEDHVRDYFKDSPEMAEIARCESHFRHFLPNGKVIRGKVNRFDIGLMQINELYHAEKATKLGYDIYTLEGNLAYAKWLYDEEGLLPWSSSSKCWKPSPNHIADSNNSGA